MRLTTLPALMMRSNSKQPFWLTGDMTPVLVLAALTLSKRGCAGMLSVMPVERIGSGIGVAGVCCAPSAMVAVEEVMGHINCGGSEWRRRWYLGAGEGLYITWVVLWEIDTRGRSDRGRMHGPRPRRRRGRREGYIY